MPSQLIDRSLKVLAKEYPSIFIRLALGQVGINEENWEYQAIENPEINIPEKRPLLPMLTDKRDTSVLEQTRELVLKEENPKLRAD
ncbi:MAG: hypothetical protein H5U02_04125, partial [Clostridia bacterium]|nr:hypothetical protein [Clostridia bacterium]